MHMKPIFHIPNELFFSEYDTTSLTLTLSQNITYALGFAARFESTKIGPLNRNPAKTANNSNEIHHSGPSPGGSIRPHPKLIRIASDLLSFSQIKDNWLNQSEFSDYHVLFTQILDPSTIEARFIAKNDEGTTFHRMLRSQNIINAINILLVDENSRKINFPRHAIVHLGLSLSPYNQENDA